jgi:outer membrane protein assembly factor BamD (BamD/ComL family)
MKKVLIIFSFIFLLFSVSAFGQKQIEPKVVRDPLMEKDATSNLGVANYYFKTKRAYIASLKRCEEIIAGNPEFSRLDEVLYVAGMSSYYLAEGKGKQKPATKTDDDKKKYDPVKLKEDAVAYLSQLTENFPQSPFFADAEKLLKEIDPKK